jgi:CDP-diglyceride synthetase
MIEALALLILANATPVVVSRLLGERGAAPIDAGRAFADGRPIFGPHKTWRGLIAGIVAAGLGGSALGVGLLVGAAFGALALTGDLGSSFVKRRLGRESGANMPLLDQLPEALLPMVVLCEPLGLSIWSMTGSAAAFLVLDLIASRLWVRRQSCAAPATDRAPER